MSEYVVKFKKPYCFEGKEYTEIDLSDIENLLARDLDTIDKLYSNSGHLAPVPEMTLAYACVVASVVTKLPIEFFKNLPAPEAMKVRYWVVNFLNVTV